jgi:hypothetical protein
MSGCLRVASTPVEAGGYGGTPSFVVAGGDGGRAVDSLMLERLEVYTRLQRMAQEWHAHTLLPQHCIPSTTHSPPLKLPAARPTLPQLPTTQLPPYKGFLCNFVSLSFHNTGLQFPDITLCGTITRGFHGETTLLPELDGTFSGH